MNGELEQRTFELMKRKLLFGGAGRNHIMEAAERLARDYWEEKTQAD